MSFPLAQLIFPEVINVEFKRRKNIIHGGLYELYEKLGLYPPRIYYFKSPLALQYAANLIKTHGKKGLPKHGFFEEYENFCTDVFKGWYDYKDISLEVHNYIRNEIKPTLKDNGAQKGLLTIDQAVSRDLKLKTGARGLKFFSFALNPSFYDRLWLNGAFEKMNVLEQQQKDMYLAYREIIHNGLMYSFVFKDMVLWCPMPETVCLDDKDRLHSPCLPALRWADDYRQYFWKGVKISPRFFEYPETIDQKDIIELEGKALEFVKLKLGPWRYNLLLNL